MADQSQGGYWFMASIEARTCILLILRIPIEILYVTLGFGVLHTFVQFSIPRDAHRASPLSKHL